MIKEFSPHFRDKRAYGNLAETHLDTHTKKFRYNFSRVPVSTSMLQGTRKGSREPFVNFWLVTLALPYRHRKYQKIRAIHQYQNIDTHITIYQYILPVPTSKCQNEKENVACWSEPLLNKLGAHPCLYPMCGVKQM
jgi:hypothetical protein